MGLARVNIEALEELIDKWGIFCLRHDTYLVKIKER